MEFFPIGIAMKAVLELVTDDWLGQHIC